MKKVKILNVRFSEIRKVVSFDKDAYILNWVLNRINKVQEFKNKNIQILGFTFKIFYLERQKAPLEVNLIFFSKFRTICMIENLISYWNFRWDPIIWRKYSKKYCKFFLTFKKLFDKLQAKTSSRRKLLS